MLKQLVLCSYIPDKGVLIQQIHLIHNSPIELSFVYFAMKRRYKELIRFNSFEERLKYLMLNGEVGADTFGFDRYMNQQFYTSNEWKQLRNYVITRDNACDLGSEGHEMYGKILIHHINPITPEDIKIGNYDKLLNPDNCISTCLDTHQIIHYGFSIPDKTIKDRRPGDTRLW